MVDNNNDITEKRVWSTKQVYQVICVTAVIVFFGTMIYARFIFVEGKVTTIDNRYKKITNRILDRLDVLEKPNSDK